MLVGSQSCARHIAAGNVEQNVDTSPLGNDVIGKFLKTGDVQHVTDDTDYIFTIGFQFLYTLVQLFLTDVYRYDFSALLHKTLGNAATQYTTCTGDDRYFTCNTELFVHNLCLLFSFFSFFIRGSTGIKHEAYNPSYFIVFCFTYLYFILYACVSFCFISSCTTAIMPSTCASASIRPWNE